MKISIDKSKLVSALNLIFPAVGHKAHLSILSNILISANQQEIKLTASDTEIEITAILKTENGEVQEDGETTIPARKMLEIIKSLPDDQKTIIRASENHCLIATSQRLKFKMHTLPAADYPLIKLSKDEIEQSPRITVPNTDLKKSINQTLFATAVQDVRYFLTGLHFNYYNNLIQLVASNGHRLALSETKATCSLEQKISTIIPKQVVIEILKRLDGSTKNVDLVFIKDIMQITSSIESKIQNFNLSSTITCKLINEKFPDYNKILPRNNELITIIDRQSLKEKLNRVAILCADRFKVIDMLFDQGDLIISSRNQDGEEATEQMEATINSNTAFNISFSLEYIVDAVSAIESSEVKISLKDNVTACLITDPSHSGYLSIVMPIKN